ncbi:MAG: putative lipid II flippase FtsW [Clostridia bacterium]|nr:putative lipid II flippase FtsW [Clostridia bacterium]
MLSKNGKSRSLGDVGLLVLVGAYALFGVIMVYSASSYNARVLYDDEFYFFKKQLIGYVLGLVAMIAVGFFDYRKLFSVKWVKWVVYIIPIILLILVFVPGIGVTNYGATRWIGLGPITVQPSELAKYGYVVFCAAYIAKDPMRVKSFLGILPLLVSGVLICILIILEPNMSVTMLVAALMISMVFLSGTKFVNLLFLVIPCLIAVPALILAEPYRLLRLSAFLNPWASPQDEGYQLIQSLYALGNGGWFGVGLFNSRQKYRFLPFAESDFILSIIGEELGFIGILILFAAAGLIVYKGFKIASACDNLFGNILASGITLVFGIQTLLNALVVSGSIPPTGLPLPLISSGNTSLIITMLSMGLLYCISRHNEERKNHMI